MSSIRWHILGLGTLAWLTMAGCSYVDVGIMGGVSRHTGQIDITKGEAAGFQTSYESRGFAIGFDFQCSACKVFQVNVAFVFSNEPLDDGSPDRDRFAVDRIDHGSMALQFRTYMMKQWLLGAHRGRYSVGFTPKVDGVDNPRTISGAGDGEGIVLGYDFVDHPFFLIGLYDSFTIDDFDRCCKAPVAGTVKSQGYRLLFGYRWKTKAADEEPSTDAP